MYDGKNLNYFKKKIINYYWFILFNLEIFIQKNEKDNSKFSDKSSETNQKNDIFN